MYVVLTPKPNGGGQPGGTQDADMFSLRSSFAVAAFAALAHILLAVTVSHQSESGEVESE